MKRVQIYKQFKNTFQHKYCRSIESSLNKIASMLTNDCTINVVLINSFHFWEAYFFGNIFDVT